MGVPNKEDEQLEMDLSLSLESGEILNLVNKAKEGDEDSYLKLYYKYVNLLQGKFIQSKLGFDFTRVNCKSDREDIESILREIFAESVIEYDPTKSKFITYLTRRILWKFRDKFLEGKLNPLRKHLSSKEMKKLIDESSCALLEDISSVADQPLENKVVRFVVCDQEIEMSMEAFLNVYILDNIDKVVDEGLREVYRYYTEEILRNSPGAITKAGRRAGIDPPRKAWFFIKKANEQILDNLKIKNIKIGE